MKFLITVNDTENEQCVTEILRKFKKNIRMEVCNIEKFHDSETASISNIDIIFPPIVIYYVTNTC